MRSPPTAPTSRGQAGKSCERQYPGSLCFYGLRKEFKLARTLSRQQVGLVGIDQVYGSTAAPFYAQLAGLVTRKATCWVGSERSAAGRR